MEKFAAMQHQKLSEVQQHTKHSDAENCRNAASVTCSPESVVESNEYAGARKQQGQLRTPLLNLLMGNIRVLFPKSNQKKIPVLHELAIDENIDILALTETHLNDDILNA